MKKERQGTGMTEILKDGRTIIFEKAVKADAAQILAYLNTVGGESDHLLFGENGFTLSVDEEERYIENLVDFPASVLLVGKIGAEIVCTGSLMTSGRERISHQSELALSVKKADWNLGIGTALMKALIAFAHDTGSIEILHLTVKANNENALRLYRKMGFAEIGIFRRYFKISGVYADAILMNLYL